MVKNYYANELTKVLKNEDSEYGYPGEILERCVLTRPLEADVVLDGFLAVTENKKYLKALLDYENAFNSDQVEKFISLCGSYKAETLYFRLKNRVRVLNPAFITSPEKFIYFLEYVDTVAESEEDENIIDEYFKYIDSHCSILYGYTGSLVSNLANCINRISLYDYKFSKDFTQFSKLVKKASENVLQDADIDKLTSYGYNKLTSKKFNYLAISSKVTGRVDRAYYEFLKQVFFGNIIADEDTKRLVKEIYDANYTLKRAINEEKKLKEALFHESFTSNSVNFEFAFEVLCEDAADHAISTITHDILISDNVYKNAPDKIKIIILRSWIRCEGKKMPEIPELLKLYKELTDVQILQYIPDKVFIKYYEAGIFENKDLLFLEKTSQEYIFVNYFTDVREQTVNVVETLMPVVNVRMLISENSSFHHKREYGSTYISTKKEVKGVSDEHTLAIYKLKEELYYRYCPEEYMTFLYEVITTAGDISIIHSKNEWRELLPEFEAAGFDIHCLDSIKKMLFSEEEYQKMIDDRDKANRAAEEKELHKLIENAENISDINWYRIYQASKEVLRHYYKKVIASKSFEQEDTIIYLYEEDVISEEEFLNFFKLKKTSRLSKKV